MEIKRVGIDIGPTSAGVERKRETERERRLAGG